MDGAFNHDEILEIAEQIERNGARFYRRAAECIEQPKAHHLLLTLAGMEDEHEQAFAAIRAESLPPSILLFRITQPLP